MNIKELANLITEMEPVLFEKDGGLLTAPITGLAKFIGKKVIKNPGKSLGVGITGYFGAQSIADSATDLAARQHKAFYGVMPGGQG